MTGRRLQEGGNREQGDVSARQGTLSIGSKPVGGRRQGSLRQTKKLSSLAKTHGLRHLTVRAVRW